MAWIERQTGEEVEVKSYAIPTGNRMWDSWHPPTYMSIDPRLLPPEAGGVETPPAAPWGWISAFPPGREARAAARMGVRGLGVDSVSQEVLGLAASFRAAGMTEDAAIQRATEVIYGLPQAPLETPPVGISAKVAPSSSTAWSWSDYVNPFKWGEAAGAQLTAYAAPAPTSTPTPTRSQTLQTEAKQAYDPLKDPTSLEAQAAYNAAWYAKTSGGTSRSGVSSDNDGMTLLADAPADVAAKYGFAKPASGGSFDFTGISAIKPASGGSFDFISAILQGVAAVGGLVAPIAGVFGANEQVNREQALKAESMQRQAEMQTEKLNTTLKLQQAQLAGQALTQEQQNQIAALQAVTAGRSQEGTWGTIKSAAPYAGLGLGLLGAAWAVGKAVSR